LSVMKNPVKTRNLPSIARSLADAGYQTDYLYGGDINFTNTKSYLFQTGYQKVMSDVDFPASVRRTHAWGVTDAIAFDSLYQQMNRHPSGQLFFTTFFTLASHEPWKVPYHRIERDERENAMAYTDDCLGRFVDSLKKSDVWENLLLIVIADHGINYPDGLTEADIRYSHIPMLWLGGCIKKTQRIEKICNQTDLAATLLAQLGLPADDFRFSRDVVHPDFHESAIHLFSNGMTFIDSTGYTVEDFNSKRILTDFPSPSSHRLDLGHALLQKSMEDYARR